MTPEAAYEARRDHRPASGLDMFKAGWEARAETASACDIDRDRCAEIERLREALDAITGFGDVNLAGEWESSLRDIIRSMTECAKRALRERPSEGGEG